MQTNPKRETSFCRRALCFILTLALALTVLSVGLSGVAVAQDVDTAESGSNYTSETTDIDIMNSKWSGADSASAFWVDATYYDYYSDEEMSGQKWLEPKQAGTGFGDADDDWYTFETFNSKISSYGGNLTYPLYFGNFCNTVAQKGSGSGSYIDSAYEFTIDTNGNTRDTRIVKDHGGPYARIINGLRNYDYFIENSNGLNERHDSVIGLAHDNLDANGNIRDKSGNKMPYFDASWLTQYSAGKSVKSYFPFRHETNAAGVTTYSFDSENAKDNVFFNWSGKTPQSVSYGQGTNYGIDDGLYNFMGDGYQAGKGIFPFNTRGSRGGNSNLDYGFGIKMNMDFRVPEYGTVDGTANGDAVTFEYSGDDDLWVYLSEYDNSGNLTNSRLILDLGGNHKQAKGYVDFSEMKSYITTEAAFAASNVKYKSDTMYIALSDGWSDVNVWAWDDGLDGIWVNKSKVTIDGQELYAFKLSDFGGRTKFTTASDKDWTKQAWDNEYNKPLNSVIHSQLGNVCWSDNPNWIEPKYPCDGEYTDLAGVSYANDTQKIKDLGDNLDPDKTYHLTVFYMERGMIESNCMMKFTMTPVKNNLKVKKTIHTDGLNDGIAGAVQAMDLNFTNSVNNTANEDSYTLGHNGTKEFTGYDTGSAVTVTEKKAEEGVVWMATDWELVDNNQNGKKLKSGTYEYDPYSDAVYETSTATDSFTLEDPRLATNTANLQVNFDNYPLVGGPLAIAKSVEGDSSNTDAFEFELLVDINGGRNYIGYDLDFDKTVGERTIPNAGTMNKGKFTMKSNEGIIVNGLPYGATYLLKEKTKDGYRPVSDFDGMIMMNNDAVEIVNIPLNGEGFLSVKKYINSGGTDYLHNNGSLFSFKAQGMDIVEGKSTVSTKGQSQEVTKTDSSGKVNFSANTNSQSDKFLKFSKIGKYAYQITETASSTPDIGKDSATIYALIDVVQDSSATTAGGALKVNSVTYYSDASLTTVIRDPAFRNPAQVGSVKVVKYSNNPKDNNSGASALGGATFNVYKVSDNGADVDEGTPVGQAKETGADGIARFENLDIYDYNTMQRQWFALVEVEGIDGRIKDNNIMYFTLPMEDADGTLKYDITYEYINGAIKNPQTAGWGYGVLPVLGWTAIILAAAVLGFWFFKNRNRGHRPAHMRG